MTRDTLTMIEGLGGEMGDFKLSNKQKDEFLNLPVIKDNFVNCWFEDQKLIMPSGQGKTLKGVVHASLEVFKSQQAKIDGLQKRIDEMESHVDINFDCEREDDQHSYWSGYNQAVRGMNEILKG